MSGLYRLAYVSSALQKFSKPQLLSLLHEAREKNAYKGITGMLLYKDGNFMQMIEGEATALHTLRQSITNDPRHHQLLVIFDEPAETRLFTDWTMGFYDLADPALEILPGFSAFMNRTLDVDCFKDDPSHCLALFNMFRGER